VLKALKEYKPLDLKLKMLSFRDFKALIKSIIYIGILKKNRKYFWRLILWSLFKDPKSFARAVTYSIYGYHFRKVFVGVS